jgi:hypothetical protein
MGWGGGGGDKKQLEFQEDQVAFDHEVVFSEIILTLCREEERCGLPLKNTASDAWLKSEGRRNRT